MYPQSLLASAEAQSIPSPTKRQKTERKSKKRVSRAPAQKPCQSTERSEAPLDGLDGEGGENAGGCFDHGGDEEGGCFDPVEPNETYGTSLEADHDSSPVPAGTVPANIELYIDAVASGVAGFKHVHTRFCVVQGWDYQRNQANVSSRGFQLKYTLR